MSKGYFDIEFVVTAEHLRLVRRMWFSWEDCEFGAPAIDCKRPYGNSDVLGDMMEILGWESTGGDDPGPSPDQEERLRQLHHETETVLQIALITGQFAPGRYRADKYAQDWRLVE